MTTAQDIIQDTLEKIGVYGPGDAMSNADAQRALTVLNDMLDSWSNESLTCFAEAEQSGALQAGVSSYTIGTGGTFNMTRPLRLIDGPGTAYIQDTNNNNYPMHVVPRDRWNLIGNRGSTVTSNVPDTLFYDPQYPLGILNVFPTPNIAYTMFWDSYLQLTDFTSLSTAASFPPGYVLAIKSNLAIHAWPYFKPDGSMPSQTLLADASTSKANIKRTNIKLVEAGYDAEIVSKTQSTYNIFRDR